MSDKSLDEQMIDAGIAFRHRTIPEWIAALEDGSHGLPTSAARTELLVVPQFRPPLGSAANGAQAGAYALVQSVTNELVRHAVVSRYPDAPTGVFSQHTESVLHIPSLTKTLRGLLQSYPELG